MKRILLPTDFSENAWNAIAYALAIFKSRECHFVLLNAFQVGSSGLITKMGRANETRLFQLLKEESENGLKEVLEKVRSIDKDSKHTFQTVSLAHSLTNAIGRTALEERIDCIIMGTKGASGLKEVFMGSNAYKTIKNINFCPIITVPDNWQSSLRKNTILFVTGYEHIFEAYEFKPVLDLSRLLNSKVVMGYMGTHEELTPGQLKAKEVAGKHLNTVDHEFVAMEEETFITTAIQKTVAENDEIGMLVMIDYWHSFFERITSEPVIKKVAFNSKVPLLVMHLVE